MINTSTYKGSEPLHAIDPNSYTVLVVDSDNRSAQRNGGYLQEAHYHVVISHRGTNIVHDISTIQPGLLVLSIGLKDIDVFEVCRRLKQHDTPVYLPIILIDPDRSGSLLLEGLAAGADDYLVEPLDEKEFIIRVERLLATRQKFDQLKSINYSLDSNLQAQSHQLEAAVKTAEQLDLLKTAIVRNVGHELRTPLLQVKSSVALLKEDIAAHDPNYRLIQMAVQAIGRLESTVMNITQLVESQHMGREPVALSETVELAIRNLERSWKSQEDHNRIIKRYPKNIPLVWADKRGIAQVLQHLLDNALKFSPEGGNVEVLIEPRGNQNVWVAVRDHGIGISEEDISHIFESFYQVDSSSTRRFNGVGVGLTLAKLIMDKIGSEIKVESVLGKGSTFSFTLPQVELPHR